MSEENNGRSERLPYLDGWRGLAIALVLYQHFTMTFDPDMGRFGVDLFFVLSGLLMSRILFEQRMPIGKFYRRRISRILPVFLLFVFACWARWGDRGASWPELVSTLTFTRTYWVHPVIFHSVIPDGNLWSLNIEEQAYILLAVMAAAYPKRWPLFLLVAFIPIMVIVHLAYYPQVPNITIECAGVGLFLSAAYREIAPKWKAPSWAPPLALFLAFPMYFHIAPWYARALASAALLAFAVNHVQDSWLATALSWKPLRQLGVLSYSIYLWQQIFFHGQTSIPDHLAVVFAILTGMASYYLFEKPARRWLNSHWGAGHKGELAYSHEEHPAVSSARGGY